MSKKAFALRMESELFKAIELWAKDEYRSVNGQIEWILYKALKESRRINTENDL